MPLPDRLPHDADVCVRIRHGDEHAFRELFEMYYAPLCRFALRLLGDRDASEDVVQALFGRLWERREDWVVRGSLRAYLYGAVHRRVIDQCRAGQVRQQYVVQELHDSASRGTGTIEIGPDQLAECADLRDACERASATLTPRRRQAFELHRHHGLSYREIAEVMGISQRTVEVHVSQALVAFRKALTAYLSVVLMVGLR